MRLSEGDFAVFPFKKQQIVQIK
ncbi:MAG: hypothetical protein RIS97_490, partial [Pseudomonadota bacterium]